MVTAFDKNIFKDAFRAWVQAHPRASDEEALAFCQAHIPAHQIVANYWLVQQSMQWFTWLKSRRAFQNEDFHEDESEGDAGRTLH